MDKTLAVTFPAGKVVYSLRQTKAMTVNIDTENLTVPTDKRWLVHWGYITNNSEFPILSHAISQANWESIGS